MHVPIHLLNDLAAAFWQRQAQSAEPSPTLPFNLPFNLFSDLPFHLPSNLPLKPDLTH
jgi:hypothetical protein